MAIVNKNLFKMYSTIQELLDKLPDIVKEYIAIREMPLSSYNVHGYELCKDYISITLESSSCSCCSPDYDYISIPVSYLWDPDWKTKCKQEYDAEKKAKEKELIKRAEKQRKEKEEAKKQAVKDKEERDKKEYERLKEKFEKK